MRSNLICLLKAQYLNQSTFNALRHEKDKKKKGKAVGVCVAISIVYIMLVGYSFLMAYGYGFLGMTAAVPGFALAITSIVNLFFTFIKTNGFLFAFKDYDILMSMPFKTETVITSKFLYMYINNLIFSASIMLSMGIGYAIWGSPSVLTWVSWILVTFFAPLIPMTIASALGALIAAIGSHFRFKILIQALLTVVFVVAIMSFNFMLNGSGSDAEFFRRLENLGEVFQTQIHRFYPISILFDQAINENRILSALALIAISVVLYFIFVKIVSIRYKAINTALMTGHMSSNYKIKKMETHSVIQAIARKEWKRFTSSIAYLMNVGMGVILAVVGSVVCLIMGFDHVLKAMELSMLRDVIVIAMPFVLAMVLTMTCTTCVSWSLEGKNLWILQSMPITNRTIFKAKMLFNLELLLPAMLICNICLIIAMRLDLITILVYLLAGVATVLFSTTFGMWAGIHLAKFDWENEIEVVKQGACSMVGIFVNLILEMILTGVAIALSFVIDGRLVIVLICAVLVGASALFYKKIR